MRLSLTKQKGIKIEHGLIVDVDWLVSESVDDVLADLLRQNKLDPLALGGPDDRLALLYSGWDVLKARNLDALFLAQDFAVHLWQHDGEVLAFSGKDIRIP